MAVHGLAAFMALAGSVQVVAEVELDTSGVSGPPPPDRKTVTQNIYYYQIIHRDFKKVVDHNCYSLF